MKNVRVLVYLIMIALALFALDDMHIVKDISMISYESAHDEQIINNKEQNADQEAVIQKNVSKENVNKQSNIMVSSQDATKNQTKENDSTQVKVENKVETEKVNGSVKKADSTTNEVGNGEVDYVQKIKNNNDKLGTLGRLYIPSVNLNVGVNHARAFGDGPYTAQEIVDKKDSAAYYKSVGKYTIADHNYQGFDKINNVKVGDKAYIKNVDGTITTMVAKARFLGENLKSNLVDKNGNSVYDMIGDIIMYTCYKNSTTTIMIVLWDIENN